MIETNKPRAGQRHNPEANPAAVVRHGEVRFTVLTSQMIRMEWAPGAAFEDHASFVFVNRYLPARR
jgi:alpha-glucosidase